MNNYAVARVFQRIADLMEIQGENPFKIKAYRTAARTMQELTESLEVLAERGELQTIPGVGEAIAQKTRDILATGTTKLYENLRKDVPETLVELLKLPGFGTRKIHQVWQELGVRNLDDLEAAARTQRLRTLTGFSVKTEENLLAAIESHRRRRERVPIGDALPYGEALVRMLEETGAYGSVELAGSLRRRQDTAGDVDLLVTSTDPAVAIEAFCTHPEVREVLERDETCASVCTHNGTKVDLYVAPPERRGWELALLTGSAAHTGRLRALAGERGLTHPTAPDETAAFALLGLPLIAPELREDRGEIEAALAGKLPALIEERDIQGVLHAHSTWSDGAASVERMAQAARALGHRYLAITDHSQALSIAGGLTVERLAAQSEAIDRANAAFTDGFLVLKGIECDILVDGALDLPVEVLAKLDFVIGSVHSHQRLEREAMTERIIRALETGVVDLLAHPTGRILGVRDPYQVDMDRVMDAARANGVAMEINAFPDRLDLNEVYARQAAERGIPISINPDAHRPEHLGLFRFGIAQARRAWLEPEQVINTWTLDRLTTWLKQRRK